MLWEKGLRKKSLGRFFFWLSVMLNNDKKAVNKEKNKPFEARFGNNN